MRSLAISIFLYACDSWTLTAELEKRTQAFEMRCYQNYLTFCPRTMFPMRRFAETSKQPLENMLNFCQDAKTEVVSQRLNVFWFSKDNPTEHSERKKGKRKGRQKKRWKGNIKQ